MSATIEQLVHGYAAAADARDREAFTALWADDAELEVRRADGEEHSARGPEGAWAVIKGLERYDRTRHEVTALDVTEDGDTATGRAVCVAHHFSGDVDIVMRVSYHDRYIRVGAEWRFARRRVEVESRETITTS